MTKVKNCWQWRISIHKYFQHWAIFPLCPVLLWTPCCCVPQAGGNELSGQSEIKFHLHTVCQQGGSSPAVICGSSKVGGEQYRSRTGRMGRRVAAPLVLSLRYSGRCGSRKSCRLLLHPMGGPLVLHLLCVWLPQPHEELTWENLGEYVSSIYLSVDTDRWPSLPKASSTGSLCCCVSSSGWVPRRIPSIRH